MTPVNLDRIQQAIDEGMIDPDEPITMRTLKEAKVVNKVEDGVKLLARVRISVLASPNDTEKGYTKATYYYIRLSCIKRSHQIN